jgi:peptidoglycan/xylan/chitin deacetylase (PgdA/CDA1 family)
MMRRAALMYHDIVPAGSEDSSGFPGRDAALYKITPELFESHLRAVRQQSGTDGPLLTFDDGGVSALVAADLLEAEGLRGCFFVTADYIGTRGFLDHRGLRALHARGHTIGSHSCSHPLRMGRCRRERLVEEWTRSRKILSDIVGEATAAASVPGGDFTLVVAHTAAEAGFATLFTSEPTDRVRQELGLMVHGRYTIQRRTSPATVAALARGSRVAAARQKILWNAKKAGKRLAGPAYLRVRKLLLRHGDDVRWGDAAEV